MSCSDGRGSSTTARPCCWVSDLARSHSRLLTNSIRCPLAPFLPHSERCGWPLGEQFSANANHRHHPGQNWAVATWRGADLSRTTKMADGTPFDSIQLTKHSFQFNSIQLQLQSINGDFVYFKCNILSS